ncbi:hypothetical protein EDC01DRAFT_356473 [Geopyxis carbonaria]|nr:hypothetical protein EDC01DRAFT_356473 [Geopyxis carbonaria]
MAPLQRTEQIELRDLRLEVRRLQEENRHHIAAHDGNRQEIQRLQTALRAAIAGRDAVRKIAQRRQEQGEEREKYVRHLLETLEREREKSEKNTQFSQQSIKSTQKTAREKELEMMLHVEREHRAEVVAANQLLAEQLQTFKHECRCSMREDDGEAVTQVPNTPSPVPSDQQTLSQAWNMAVRSSKPNPGRFDRNRVRRSKRLRQQDFVESSQPEEIRAE